MRLDNQFTVAAPVDRVWDALLDLERVGACVPGATLEPGPDGAYRGTIKVKLGPVRTAYAGTVKLLDVDEDTRSATMQLDARETVGHGSASALVTNRVSAEPDGSTRVSSVTDLAIAGRAAQLGHGMLEGVAGSMLEVFSARLAEQLAQTEPDSASATAAPADTGEVFDTGSLFAPLLHRYRWALAVALAAPVVGVLARRAPRRRSLSLSLRVDVRL